jgi:hypothetical protein
MLSQNFGGVTMRIVIRCIGMLGGNYVIPKMKEAWD